MRINDHPSTLWNWYPHDLHSFIYLLHPLNPRLRVTDFIYIFPSFVIHPDLHGNWTDFRQLLDGGGEEKKCKMGSGGCRGNRTCDQVGGEAASVKDEAFCVKEKNCSRNSRMWTTANNLIIDRQWNDLHCLLTAELDLDALSSKFNSEPSCRQEGSNIGDDFKNPGTYWTATFSNSPWKEIQICLFSLWSQSMIDPRVCYCRWLFEASSLSMDWTE